MTPAGEPGGLGYILKDYWAIINETACSDRSPMFVINGSEHARRGYASAHAVLCGLRSLLSLARCIRCKGDQQCATNQTANMQGYFSIK